ncbi:Cytochrome P450 83A1 [Leucoagaricus sp. SymC.cos]|nr:Cytochrome P450 83A1 [Leucoagaricus sp. SymC.cos]
MLPFLSATTTALDTGGLLAVGWCMSNFLRERRSNPNGVPLLPGSKRYPIIGNLLKFPAFKPWEQYGEWPKTYGDMIHFKVFGQSFLVLGSVERANDLLDKRSLNYSDSVRMPMLGELYIPNPRVRKLIRKIPRMDWAWNLVAMPYGVRRRRHCRVFQEHFHSSLRAFKFRPVQVSSIRAFLRKLLNSPDDFLHRIRWNLTSTFIEDLLHSRLPTSGEEELVVRNTYAVAIAGKSSFAFLSTIQSFFMTMTLCQKVQNKAQEELERCPPNSSVCLTVINTRPTHPSEPPRILQVVPVASGDMRPKFRTTNTTTGTDIKEDHLQLTVHGLQYMRQKQKAVFHLHCDEESDADPSVTKLELLYSWNGTHVFSWKTAHGCPHVALLHDESKPKSGHNDDSDETLPPPDPEPDENVAPPQEAGSLFPWILGFAGIWSVHFLFYGLLKALTTNCSVLLMLRIAIPKRYRQRVYRLGTSFSGLFSKTENYNFLLEEITTSPETRPLKNAINNTITCQRYTL